MVGSPNQDFETGGQTWSSSRKRSAKRASLQVTERRAGDGATVVDLTGELTSKTLGTCNDQLVRIIANGRHRVVINLEGLTMVTPAGARTLLVAARFLIRIRGRMILCNASQEIETTLRDTRFANLLWFRDSEEEAIDAVLSDGRIN